MGALRILTVGNMYPPHHLGGYEQDWAAGVAALRAAGHAVRVLASDHREAGVERPDEPDVHRELRWYWHDHAFPRRTLRERLAIERANAATLARHLEELRPDVVSWWPMGGLSLGLVEQVRRAGIPALGVVYDDWMVYGPRVDAWQATWRGRARRPAGILAAAATGLPVKLDAARSARWLFCSRSVLGAALKEQPGIRDRGLLAPGLDEVFLDPAPPREWQWRLLAPSRLDPRKGLMSAVEALALLPEARLRIVGGGDDRHAAELRRAAERLGVAERFQLDPPCPREQLAAAYADADAVLFPVVWAEPFGLVPLEAMGIGRPVVATGRGGSGEYLRDGENALLHEAGDAAALAAAVERLAADPALRERLRAGGFQAAPGFARSIWDGAVVAEHERRAAS